MKSDAPSHLGSQASDPNGAPLSLAEGAGLIAEMSQALRRMEQATAEAVALVGRVQRAGVCEELEGLPLELLLALQHRVVSSDARMLLEAGRVLNHLPVTKTLFAEGRLSWGQVRGIVTCLRRLKIEDLPRIDERVAASLEQIDKYNPDELVWAVERAAYDIDGARKVERREQRTVEASFLAVQPSFDGSVRLYGELDPVSGATCLNALEAASDPPNREPGESGRASRRARQRAQGLVRICGDWLGGTSTQPAQPLLIAHVDVANATPTAAGTVELAAPGVLPTLTAATVEAMTLDADLRVVLFDGARPLAVSAKTKAVDIPSDTRIAVVARDRGLPLPRLHRPCEMG